jgi:4'-phosphopantetheinyl transferase
MPLENLKISENRIWGLWKISEDRESLEHQIQPFETISPELTNSNKILEFLSSRVLLKELLKKWDVSFEGLTKDDAGKPYLKNSDLHISLSHSYPYVAALIDKQKSVGIDLEQPKEKLFRIAERVLSKQECENAGSDVVKHCIYWCAKEALIKVYGKRHLHLAKELAIEPFELAQKGVLSGSIIADNTTKNYTLDYHVYDNFVVVFNQ